MNLRAWMAVLLLPTASWSQTWLPDVVVTATGYPISARDALVPVEVFDREDIRNSNARDLGDLLRLSNGLELGRNGGPGQPTSLFFRGTDSDQNLVLINGVPINSATVASAALQHIDTQLLYSVEVVKGPQSTLWGSGAIGGVISVETLAFVEDGLNGFAEVEAGGDDTQRLATGFSFGQGNSSVMAGVSYFTTDGIPTLDIATNDSGYNNTTFNIGLSHQFEGVEIATNHWQTKGTTEYQAFTFPPPTFSLILEPVSQDFDISVSALSISHEFVDGVTSTLQISLVRDHIDENDSIDFAHTDRTLVNWRNRVDFSNGDTGSFGAEAAWEKASIESFGSGYSGTTDYQSVFAQYDARRWAHNLLAGIRLIRHEDAGDHVTGNLGYGYRLDDRTVLKANFSTGFRFPTAVERFVFSPNPDLKPERSQAIELGVSYLISPGQQLDVSLFRTEIKDLIVSVGVFPNSVNENIDKARIHGIDAAYSLARGPWFLRTSVLVQDPRDVSNDKKLLRRADYSAKARLDYTGFRYELGAELIYSDERDDIDGITFLRTTTDAYTLMNLHGSYDLDPHWQLFGKIDNLLDTDYELVSRYNTPGRTLSVGIRYDTD
ncbi:MAG: TonB-dependent receptor [Sedimenticolaceae bacterium]